MRLTDGLALLAAHWRLPYTQLETYQRVLVKAGVLPKGASGRGIMHVDAETLARFLIAFCGSFEPIKSPHVYQALTSSLWHPATSNRDAPSASRSPSLLTCITSLIAEGSADLDVVRFDASNRIVEARWEPGPDWPAGLLATCRDFGHRRGEYDTDFEQGRAFGRGTADLLAKIAGDKL